MIIYIIKRADNACNILRAKFKLQAVSFRDYGAFFTRLLGFLIERFLRLWACHSQYVVLGKKVDEQKG